MKYSGFKTLNSTKDGYIIESLKNTRYNRISFCHANFQIACYIYTFIISGFVILFIFLKIIDNCLFKIHVLIKHEVQIVLNVMQSI